MVGVMMEQVAEWWSWGAQVPGNLETHHQPQHQCVNTFPNLRRDVAAKLLQGGEETFELAELPCPTCWGQVLCGQRGSR